MLTNKEAEIKRKKKKEGKKDQVTTEWASKLRRPFIVAINCKLSYGNRSLYLTLGNLVINCSKISAENEFYFNFKSGRFEVIVSSGVRSCAVTFKSSQIRTINCSPRLTKHCWLILRDIKEPTHCLRRVAVELELDEVLGVGLGLVSFIHGLGHIAKGLTAAASGA